VEYISIGYSTNPDVAAHVGVNPPAIISVSTWDNEEEKTTFTVHSI
jgi:hypothetical protein